jgi:hypothetical protein
MKCPHSLHGMVNYTTNVYTYNHDVFYHAMHTCMMYFSTERPSFAKAQCAHLRFGEYGVNFIVTRPIDTHPIQRFVVYARASTIAHTSPILIT